MGVLVVMQNWQAPSELWAQRMIAMLEPDVVAIAADDPQETHWRGRIPTIRLANGPVSLWRRVGRRLGFDVDWRPTPTAADVLAEAIARCDVEGVLLHYLSYAVRFEAVLSACGKPVFVHCHGYDVTWDHRRHQTPDRPSFGPEYREAARRLAQHVCFVANSARTRQQLLNVGVADERIVVKHIGVPIPKAPPERTCRRPVQILYLGRLVDCKGPDRTIEAFERACDDGLDGELIVAGDGPLRTTCELQWRRSPVRERIRLLGAVDGHTATQLRKTADIFTAHNCFGVLSRQEEAYGVTFLEAMADGLPVVTGRSGGVVETIVDGETGILFEPGDVAAHAAALRKLADDASLRRRYGGAGWQHVKQHFSLEQERVTLRQILMLDASSQASAAPAGTPATCGVG